MRARVRRRRANRCRDGKVLTKFHVIVCSAREFSDWEREAESKRSGSAQQSGVPISPQRESEPIILKILTAISPAMFR